jgi:hypothetical protein
MACSQRKRNDKGMLPAIERYDGPAFRVLRKYLQEHQSADVITYILSAKFGLIDGKRLLHDYNRRMSSARADSLRPLVAGKVTRLLRQECWDEIGICLGRDYFRTMPKDFMRSCDAIPVSILGGGLGKRLTSLRSWLNKEQVLLSKVTPR